MKYFNIGELCALRSKIIPEKNILYSINYKKKLLKSGWKTEANKIDMNVSEIK